MQHMLVEPAARAETNPHVARRPAAPPPGEEPAADWRQVYRDFWLAVSCSMLLHLLLLLALFVWKFMDEPAQRGVVIQSALLDDGPGEAVPEVVTISAGDVEAHDQAPEELAASPVDPSRFLELTGAAIDVPLDVGALGAAPGMANVTGEGHGQGGGGVGFFGTRGEGQSFVFVVDCSGSMRGGRIKRARRELVRAIRNLKSYQRFFIYFYNHDTYPMFGLTSSTDLLAATPDVRRKAEEWVEQCEAFGDTEPADALRRGLAMQPDVVFFLTDGEIPPESRDVVRNANRDEITVHTTAFQNPGGIPIMKAIAADNGGTFRFVD